MLNVDMWWASVLGVVPRELVSEIVVRDKPRGWGGRGAFEGGSRQAPIICFIYFSIWPQTAQKTRSRFQANAAKVTY